MTSSFDSITDLVIEEVDVTSSVRQDIDSHLRTLYSSGRTI